jgi:hypothetical protein
MMSRNKEYSDKKTLNLYKSEHVEPVQEALDAAEAEMDEDDPPETERIAHIARTYRQCRQFRRLETDQRVREAMAVVAKDHGLTKDEISLVELLKITSGAYLGYQQTSDWRPSNAETVGFKEEIKTDGGKHD